MKRSLLHSLFLCGLPIASMTAQEVKPNILWIVTDDQRADALACWNRATRGTSESELGYVSSPNIDKLASEGVLFTHSYCNSPVSAPSRASMHTGRYPHHSSIYNFDLTHNTYDFAKPLVPEVMRNAGYKTILFGKAGVRIFKKQTPLRFDDDPANNYDEKVAMESDLERVGITDWCQTGAPAGQDPGTTETWYYPDGSKVSYYRKRNNGDLTAEDIATTEAFNKKHKVIRHPQHHMAEILAGESPMPTEKTLDGRIAEEFMSYLDHENKNYKILRGREIEGPNTQQPQFINLGFHFPHTAVMPSKEYRDQFLDKTYKFPDFGEEDLKMLPKQLAKWKDQYDVTTLSDEDKQQIIRDYYAFCAMGDHLLGQAVDKFKAYCAKNNQPYIIVIACGDHGWHLGEQGVSYKAANYVKSNQTAVIVVSSDKKTYPAGKVVNDFIEYVDFAPTFFAAAGYNVDTDEFDYLDGRDIAKTVTNKIAPRDYVLGETSVSSGYRAYLRGKEFAFSMRNRPATGIKKPNDNIKWALECTPEEADMALFDLRVDPQERVNLAYTEEYKELANFFRNKLGNIVLGDNRLECIWKQEGVYNISDFAVGSDDKKLDIPSNIIPTPAQAEKYVAVTIGND